MLRGRPLLLAAVLGCGASRTPTAPSNPPPSSDTGALGKSLTLLDRGAPPRRVLRYRHRAPFKQTEEITDDSTTTLTVDGAAADRSSGKMTLRIAWEAKSVRPNGTLDYAGRIEDIDIPASNAARNRIRESVWPLVGLHFSGSVSAQGVGAASLDEPSVPLTEASSAALERMRRILREPFQLPDAEVGVGAKWSYESEIPSKVFALHRHVEVALTRMDADAVTVTVTTVATTDAREIPMRPPLRAIVRAYDGRSRSETSIPLDGMSSKGRGHTVEAVDFDATNGEQTKHLRRVTETDYTFGPAP